MSSQGTIFGRTVVRHALALLACAALLYFAAGGSLFHEHTNGPDTACHICQALHMPALAAVLRCRSMQRQAIPFLCIAPGAHLPSPDSSPLT